ncbi:MAG: hypothetical protein Q4C77_15045 [Eubacteriales bacterium]|nr:hypothetical protein [Eubacteriales bacterium]
MPGYILHLTCACMALEMMPESSILRQNTKERNAFLAGNFAPDAVTDKSFSHFRSPDRNGAMIEYPEVTEFRKKYRHLFGDSSCLGYDFHLYIDRRFFLDYLPLLIEFQDEDGKSEIRMDRVAKVLIKRTGRTVPKNDFFSEEYYYGDFTKMNSYLIKHFHLPVHLDMNIQNPGIREVDYSDIAIVMEQLKEFCSVPEKAADDLKVFEMENLLNFLREATGDWVEEWNTGFWK